MYKSLIQRQWARRSSLFDHLRNHWCRLKSKIDKLLAWLDPPGTGSERPSNPQFNRKYNYKKKNKRKLKTRIARVEITSMEEKIRLRWQHWVISRQIWLCLEVWIINKGGKTRIRALYKAADLVARLASPHTQRQWCKLDAQMIEIDPWVKVEESFQKFIISKKQLSSR